MTRLTYYNQNVAVHPDTHHLPGIKKYSLFFKYIYSATIAVVDRTNTIRLPLQTASLFPIPVFRPLTRTFEEICNERALEILARMEKLGSNLYVFWSGGIDSTLLLISLLKQATIVQREKIIILMTEDSIAENPNFYRDHVRGKLNTESANRFPHILGTNHLLTGGEGNDQLFGSDVVARLIQKFGPSSMHIPYNRDMLFAFFNENAQDPDAINFYLNLFEKLRSAAPIPLDSNFDHLWWINFSLKWQSVFMRILSYVPPQLAGNITSEYVHTNYIHFYHTDEFQLWSLNNHDKKIKDEWRTYKWVCKDIIYDYTKDADYRDNKIKRGSLYSVLMQRSPFNFIDDTFCMYDTLRPEEYYNVDNDFI